MESCGKQWNPMEILGNPWDFVEIHGIQWKPMEIWWKCLEPGGNPWSPVEIHRTLWKFKKSGGNSWKPVDIWKIRWKSMEFDENPGKFNGNPYWWKNTLRCRGSAWPCKGPNPQGEPIEYLCFLFPAFLFWMADDLLPRAAVLLWWTALRAKRIIKEASEGTSARQATSHETLCLCLFFGTKLCVCACFLEYYFVFVLVFWNKIWNFC